MFAVRTRPIPKMRKCARLLTGEINAAVQGFIEGGATEVVVWDGHDGSQTLRFPPSTLGPKLIMGALSSTMLMERKFAAVAFVGQHARANSRGGVMAHSYSSLGIQNMLMNGKPWARLRLEQLSPDGLILPSFSLAEIRRQLSSYMLLCPGRRRSGEGRSLELFVYFSFGGFSPPADSRAFCGCNGTSFRRFRHIGSKDPVTFQIEYTSRSALGQDAGLRPGAEIIDARTIRFRAENFLKAWQASRL